MQIIAALYVETIEFRPVEGGSTRIDIGGAHFSVPVEEFPATLEPHLVVLIRCPEDHPGTGFLDVVFRRGDEEVARNRQPLMVEPGKFGYRLVRAELEFTEPGTIDAHCTIEGTDQTIVVPFTAMSG